MAELAGIAGCPDGDDGSDCDIGTMTTVDALRRATFGTRGICLFPRLACRWLACRLRSSLSKWGRANRGADGHPSVSNGTSIRISFSHFSSYFSSN